MEYSDDKTNIDVRDGAVDTEQQCVDDDAVGTAAPCATDDPAVVCATEKSETEKIGFDGGESSDGTSVKRAFDIDELIAIGIKAVAVTVSVILLLTSLLAVALPLQAMRVFNLLGMTDRAVDFGERYISRELRAYDA